MEEIYFYLREWERKKQREKKKRWIDDPNKDSLKTHHESFSITDNEFITKSMDLLNDIWRNWIANCEKCMSEGRFMEINKNGQSLVRGTLLNRLT